MSTPLYSPLLRQLSWVEHAFQPAGEPPPADARYAHQRHSATVLTDRQAWPAKSQPGDAVIGSAQHAVAVYTADCLPLLIADNRQRRVAAVHGGLQGVTAGVINAAVRALAAAGSAPGELFVAIGPSIGPCCYELGEEAIARLRAAPLLHDTTLPLFATAAHNPRARRPQARAQQHGQWCDLPALAEALLRREGVPAAQIERLGVCTYCEAEAQASYRRNTHTGEGYASRYSWIRRQG
ncbi:polyphenol oxidase family protein [Pantoea sp. 1.19]|uniref:polyphenol oxidase family protein n=1 Tax=Pantoea sp. 1.19 TaxID=1925589 RepID=UPI000948B5BA|nr:polyphenol oxidase family protein [Pantoea sp. 1.19]